MQSATFASLALCGLLAGCAAIPAQPDLAAARQQVLDTERAFARTMAERDLGAFAGFIADEAVFFTGPSPLRGRPQIVEWWKRYYAGAAAPFSWEPEQVEVLASGTLALSSGPVRNAQGEIVARFSSVWRREAPATWRIVFDQGSEVCRCLPR